jgi:hypothetical protein
MSTVAAAVVFIFTSLVVVEGVVFAKRFGAK